MDIENRLGNEKVDVYLTVPGDTCSSIQLVEEDGDENVVVAIVFNERLAEEIGEFIVDRYDQPEGTVIQVKLEHVHPDMLETWIREE
jgi:nitrogen regulatory protein PII-like uncharacterized protein